MVRTAEEGSRPMIRAAVGGEKKDEPRGAFISSVSQEEPRDYANSQEGLVAQNKIWVYSTIYFLYFVVGAEWFEE